MRHEFVTLEGSDPMEVVEYARVDADDAAGTSSSPRRLSHVRRRSSATRKPQMLQFATLQTIAVSMSDPVHGIRLHTRRRGMKHKHGYFRASDVVAWLIDRYPTQCPGRAKAVGVARQLDALGTFDRVQPSLVKEPTFCDSKHHIYKFAKLLDTLHITGTIGGALPPPRLLSVKRSKRHGKPSGRTSSAVRAFRGLRRIGSTIGGARPPAVAAADGGPPRRV